MEYYDVKLKFGFIELNFGYSLPRIKINKKKKIVYFIKVWKTLISISLKF